MTMREIQASAVTTAVVDALKQINYQIEPKLKAALGAAKRRESSPLGRQALELLEVNADMAAAGLHPLCQDTGLTVIEVQVGQETAVVGGDLEAALQAGVRQATQEARLRNSVSVHPLTRRNTGDNTPAVVHYRIVPGKGLKLKVMAKGGGCENASALTMLSPAAGRRGVEEFVLQTVSANGAAACPPLIVGIGLGGNFETAPWLAKRALFRPLGEASPDPVLAELEASLLERINGLGLGPQGWGGTVTALAVAIEAQPCHIASLPAAVNLECHSHRVLEVNL
jgi:fumarate hydratase subunit alpha